MVRGKEKQKHFQVLGDLEDSPSDCAKTKPFLTVPPLLAKGRGNKKEKQNKAQV